jgi:transcriptional regulator with XRE-family HTH domain
MKPINAGSEYDFVLVLTDGVTLTNQLENALFEAGCDDATLSARSGRLYLRFSRQAASAKEAILSAIANVRAANVGADVLRVDDCNLVTQAEIARRIGRSRQLINQYITGIRGPGKFPAPACELCEGSPLWYWCEVAYWLAQNDMITQSDLQEAEEVDAINAVLEIEQQRRMRPQLMQEVERAVQPKCPACGV